MLAAITSQDIVIFVIVFVLVCLLAVGVVILPARIAALKARLPVGNFELVTMMLRKVNPKMVVQTTARLHEPGHVEATVESVEISHLAGVNLHALLAGLSAAKQSNVQLSLSDAQTIALAGRDLEAEVRRFAKQNSAKNVRMSVASVLAQPAA